MGFWDSGGAPAIIIGLDVMQSRFGVNFFNFGPANCRKIAGEFLNEF